MSIWYAVIGHLYLNEFIFSSRLAKNCRKVSRPPDRTSGGSRGGARGARPPPLFLDQTEARRAEKILFGDRGQDLEDHPPAPLSEGLDLPLRTVTEISTT